MIVYLYKRSPIVVDSIQKENWNLFFICEELFPYQLNEMSENHSNETTLMETIVRVPLVYWRMIPVSVFRLNSILILKKIPN